MKDEKGLLRVEISYKTVIFTIGFLIGLWLLVQLRQVIVIILLSIILLSALLKPVEWLNAHKIPRILSVVIVYVLLILGLGFVISTIVPPLFSETSDFVNKIPQIIPTINDFLLFHKIPIQDIQSIVSKQAQQLAGSLFSISTAVISSIFFIITILVLTFYLLLEWKTFLRFIVSPFSAKQEKKVMAIIAKVENGLGQWVRGQITLSLAVGLLTYVGLRILQIPYALPLSLIAGILEILPIIGPIIAAIPAILVGLTIAPVVALATAALFFVVQQIENHLVVPLIMSRVIGLQPPIVIITLLVGAKLYGIGGAFLSIPILVAAKIIIKELFLEEDSKVADFLEEE